MQAIILSAGQSSRFWPLNKKHKSLFQIEGRPLICHTLENLKKVGIGEAIIVQAKERSIENELKKHKLPPNLKVRYVIQEVPRGTGDALKSAKNYLKEKFLVLNGDDFYETTDLKKCLSKFPAILVKKVKNPSSFGVIVPKKDYVKEIFEKSQRPKSNLVNAGCYFIPKTILAEKIEKSLRGEYEITDYIKKLAKKQKVYFLKAEDWIPLSFNWDLLNINEFLLKKIKTRIKGKIEKNCYLKGQIIVGKGTVIKSGTYIEGPVYIGENCQIGPNCFIRGPVSIGSGCLIGRAVEIGKSIIGDNSNSAHLSYIGDSIIGENCNLGAGTITANLRFDEKNVHSLVKGKLIDTQRKKFGAVLGNNVKTGINVSLMPGILIGSGSLIGPHSVVFQNLESNTKFYSKFQGVKKKIKK